MKMKRLGAVALFMFAFLMGVMAFGAEAATAPHDKHIDQCVKLLQKIEKHRYAAPIAKAIEMGKGVVIFPTVIDAALGIGGMGGDGVVLLKDDKGKWYGPSFAKMGGGSLGLQAGVKEVGIIFIINDAEGLAMFTGGRKFRLGADISAVAGPFGGDLNTGKTTKRAGAPIYTYTISEGLFVGVSIEDVMLEAHSELNKAYWGKSVDPNKVLTVHATDAKVAPLVHELNLLEKKAK